LKNYNSKNYETQRADLSHFYRTAGSLRTAYYGAGFRREFFPPESSPAKRAVENWQQLEISGQRSGPADARVRIVEFYDYQCPFCKSVQPAVKAVRRQYPDQVSIVHEHYPLGGHEFAFGAAVAAECAARQGTFERYHELLFARQDSLGTVSYVRLADEAGIKDAESFRRCVEDEETAEIVESGVALGNQLEIGGIPTFLINGTLVSGALSEQRLEELVKQALEGR